MKKLLIAVISLTCLLAACTEPFKKTKDGLEYKIVRGKGGKVVATGDFMELQIVEKYKDSILSSTIEQGMPQFAAYDTTQFPPELKEIFAKVYVGDSIVLKVSTDTIAKKSQLAPFMKKGEFVYSTYKITNAYKNQADADKARNAAMINAQAIQLKKGEAQKVKDDKIIADYLKKNNITAVKAPMGTYVQIISPGTGAQVDTSMLVDVNYTGKTLEGFMFDSNTDPAKGHLEPLMVNLTSDQSLGNIIQGWKDALPLLKIGSKAKFYIPSTLAYGAQGSAPDIKPNEVLVFDIDVLDQLTKAQATVKMQEMQNKMQEMQQKYMDSMQKAQPQTK